MAWREITRTIPQPGVLNILANNGMYMTSQTLRNWERKRVISEPTRTCGHGGRVTEYNAICLPEIGTAWTMSKSGVPLSVIASARYACSHMGEDAVPAFPHLRDEENMLRLNDSEKVAFTVDSNGRLKLECSKTDWPEEMSNWLCNQYYFARWYHTFTGMYARFESFYD